MISKLSNRIVTNWLNGEVIKKEYVSAYQYGCELLVSEMISNIVVLSVAFLMGKVIEMFLFIIVFSYIRVVCGGYHSTSYRNCILFFSTSTITFFFSADWLVAQELHQVLILLGGISALSIFILAPVDHVNKPLTKEEKVEFREKTLKRLLLILLALAITYSIFPILLDILIYGCLAIIDVGFLLILGWIVRNSFLLTDKQV